MNRQLQIGQKHLRNNWCIIVEETNCFSWLPSWESFRKIWS